MIVETPITTANGLAYINNPINIILVDCRETKMKLSNIDNIHKTLGLKMFAYHYYITQEGKIQQGRPEKALAADVSVLMDVMYGTGSANGGNLTELTRNNKIESSNKIFVCIEADTRIRGLSSGQETSLINLCRDIMSRYRNIRNTYSMTEILKDYNNLGGFVDMNKLRSKINDSIPPLYIDLPGGDKSITFGSRRLYYDSETPLIGNDVKTLQVYFEAIGINIVNMNGQYDVFTLKDVELFQKIYNLPVTGEMTKVDYDTLIDLILSLDTKKDYSKYYRYLKYRENKPMSGEDIITIQTKLSKIKYLKTISGKYDLDTENAVKNFQTNNNLTIDGEIGPITWQRITESLLIDYNRVLKLTEPPMEGNDIRYIQLKIKANSGKFNIMVVSNNGIYDRTTYNNVRKIQMSLGIPITGEIDQNTWNILDKL